MKYIIIRILGNDLPPRHGKEQTYKNLEFTLKNEAKFKDCEKRWIVNRIIDPDAEKAIIKLLQDNKQTFFHLPFSLDGYNKNWDIVKKVEFIVQLNLMRNIAISEGEKIAEWVFPMDSNIFITRDGWENITRQLDTLKEDLVKLWMYRVIEDNSEVFDFLIEAYEKQEPQVIIRRNSNIRFNQALCYGNRNKLELLWNYPDAPFVDYVVRLNDYSYGFISKKRYNDRNEAILSLIERIEANL
jgi:hypothetical protein